MKKNEFLAVMYHYILDGEHRFPKLNGISFDRFKEQIDMIMLAHKIVPSGLILKFLAGDKDSLPKNAVALTFDDGLAEHRRVAEYLAGIGISASFFIPTRILEERIILPVHKLHILMSKEKTRELSSAAGEFLSPEEKKYFSKEFLVKQNIVQYPYDSEEDRYFKFAFNFLLESRRKEKVLDALFGMFFKDEAGIHDKFYLSGKDIVRMREWGHEIGSHSHSHAALSAVDAGVLAFEMEHSKKTLESFSCAEVNTIAYPYGTKASLSEKVFTAARRAGYLAAYTAFSGSNDAGCDRMALKRIDPNSVDKFLT